MFLRRTKKQVYFCFNKKKQYQFMFYIRIYFYFNEHTKGMKNYLFPINFHIYSLQFHQTIKTYLNHRVWQFYFYVSKSWPDEPVFLHFPGCTSTPNNHIYESFGFFCPINALDNIEKLRTEDVLLDWSRPMYLNYTHVNIVDRLEEFFNAIGRVERIQGEVYLCGNNVETREIGELPSNEVVNLFGHCI